MKADHRASAQNGGRDLPLRSPGLWAHRGWRCPPIGQLVGLFWRPLPRLVLRADYLFSTRTLQRLEPGLHASLSILFW